MGTLLSVIARVPVPEVVEHLSVFSVVIYFISGGIAFIQLDSTLREAGVPSANWSR